MRRPTSGFLWTVFGIALVAISVIFGARFTLPAKGQSTPADDDGRVFLPIVMGGAERSDSEREWDPRLDQRGAVLIEATVTPGQGYWRLIKARWYNTEESDGRHHIFVDVLDENGDRKVGIPVLVTWPEGSTTVVTEAKPGEEYATNSAMFALAPAYAAHPTTARPPTVWMGWAWAKSMPPITPTTRAMAWSGNGRLQGLRRPSRPQ